MGVPRERKGQKFEEAEWMKSPMFNGVSPIEDFEMLPLSKEDRDENREIAYDI